MSLTKEGYLQRKWGPYPSLGKALGDKATSILTYRGVKCFAVKCFVCMNNKYVVFLKH